MEREVERCARVGHEASEYGVDKKRFCEGPYVPRIQSGLCALGAHKIAAETTT